MENLDSCLQEQEQIVPDNGEHLLQNASAEILPADAGQNVQDGGVQIVQFDWGQFVQFDGEQFVTIALVLILIYQLLHLFDSFLVNGSFFGRMHSRVRHWVHNLFLIYEPIALLLIGVSLVLISPLFIGLLVFILLLGGLSHIRNYFSGRLVQLDRGIQKGKQIKMGTHQGVISAINRLGLRLNTSKGMEFMSYQQLLASGYILSAGDDLGGFYRLTIRTAKEDQSINALRLKDQLTTTPYLDWHHDTEIVTNFEHSNQVDARVLVREDHQLQDLLALITEWGYHCKVAKK